jgi:glycosidase
MEDFIFGPTNFSDRRIAERRQRLGGLVHDYRMEPLAPRPGEPVTVWMWAGDDLPIDSASCYMTTDAGRPDGSRGAATQGCAVAMSPATVEWSELRWSYGRWWRCQLPPQPEGTVVRYRLEGYARFSGLSAWADGGACFAYQASSRRPAAWAADAIIYHVYVDRFYPGDGRAWLSTDRPATGFRGGTLQGVIEKLGYVSDLGANTIWLSPIFASPSNHGYDCTDYYNVDPRYGDNGALRRLVREAHGRGLRVLLDFVPNHCSHLHPFFLDAQRDRTSRYRDWFTFRNWPNDYATFFGVKSLPQWNLENPETRRYIIDVACHWLTEYGVDGYRLDYTLGPSHDFWTAFHNAVHHAAPDCFCIAEAVESPEVMRSYSGRMDGCLDFPLLDALRRVFGHDAMDVARLETLLEQRASFFGDSVVLGTFLDNHDMNRFLWMAGGDKRRLKLAALCQFTLPSPPVVYYGTEVGIVQSGDVRGPQGNAFHHHARTPMPWGDAQDSDLLAYYRRLAALRREHASLRAGERIALLVDAAAGAYAYACVAPGDLVVVTMNNSDALRPLAIPVSGLGLRDGSLLADAFGGARAPVAGGTVSVNLPARGGAALVEVEKR